MLKPILLLLPLLLLTNTAQVQAQLQNRAPTLAEKEEQTSLCNPRLSECPNRGPRFGWTTEPIPYVVAPRRTQLLTTQPQLRWLPVPGASHYTVIIEGEDRQWWQTQTRATEITYGGDPLAPGQHYKLIILADTGESSLSEPFRPGDVSFQVLTLEAQEQVRAQLAALEQDNLNLAAYNQQIVQVYLAAGLVTEAIAQLEDQWAQEPQAAIAQQLGVIEAKLRPGAISPKGLPCIGLSDRIN